MNFKDLRVFFLLIFFFNISTFLHAELCGVELSDYFFNELKTADFNVRPQNLTDLTSKQFPYSLSISFSNSDILYKNSENRLYIALPIEIAFEIKSQLFSLFFELKEKNIPINTVFVLQASEYSILPEKYTENFAYGSTKMIENIYNKDNCAVIVITKPESLTDSLEIIPGANGFMTPLWLIRQIPLEIYNNSLLSYRLNLAKMNKRLEMFLANSIPAVGISFDSENKKQQEQLCSVLEQIITNYSIENKDKNNSSTYMVINLFGKKIWLNEIFFVFLYLITAIIVLFSVCGFSLFGEKQLSIKKDLLNVWYIIPIIIIISVLFLLLGQSLGEKLSVFFNTSPLFILYLKTFFSLILIAILFAILVIVKLPLSQVIYGYLITLISLVNIFVFSTIDITLLIVFLLEYLVIYFARFTKKTIWLFIISFFILIPFVPYVINIAENVSPEKLNNLIVTDFWGNLLYALMLIPLEIMWLRIFIRLNVYGKQKGMSIFKIYGMAFSLLLILLLMISTILSVATKIQGKKISLNEKQNYEIKKYEQTNNEKDIPVKIYFNIFNHLDFKTVDITIQSDLTILWYKINIKSPNSIPIYDSDFEFRNIKTIEGGCSNFFIPYLPPKKSKISYITKDFIEQNIFIEIFCLTPNNDIILVTKNILL